MSNQAFNWLRLTLTSLFLVFSMGLAWALPPGVRATVSFGGFDEYLLDNGLKAVLRKQAGQNGAVLNLIYRVGSRDEGPGTTGHAHLLEHMLFKGCGDVPDVKAALQSRGIQANAETRQDSTNYFARTPDGDASLGWLIGLQAQCMHAARFTAADLASEMTVVRNEFERFRSSTGANLLQALRAAAFQFHPYGRPVVGQQKDIEQVDFAQLRGFYTSHYRPDNAVLVIVGSFDAQAVLSRIAATLGAVPRPASPLRPTMRHEPPQAGEREATVVRVGSGGLLALGYRIPEGRHPDRYALNVLGRMLAQPRQGVVAQALESAKLGTLAAAAADDLVDPGLFMMIAQASDSTGTHQLKDFLINQLEVNLPARLTDEALQAAQQTLAQARAQLDQNPQALAMALTSAVAQGDWRLVFAERDGVAAVTLADVKRVADAYLQKFNRNVAILVAHGYDVSVEWRPAPPLAEQLATLQQRQAPEPGEVLSADPQTLQARTRRWSPRPGWQVAWLDKLLPGGAAKLDITLRFARPADLQGRFGTELMGPLLSYGSAGAGPDDLQQRLAALATQVRFEAEGQRLSIHLSGPRQNLNTALQVVATAVRQPRWDEASFERLRSNALAQVPEAGVETAPTLSLMLARAINAAGSWPSGDPQYLWVGQEGRTAWRNLSMDALRTQHATLWGAANLQVAGVGALDQPALEAALDQAFGHWQPGRPYEAPALAHVPVPGQRHHARIVDRPFGVMQALQYLPMNANDADRWPLELALRMLGGPMGSRLWNRLREEEGISYTVQSVFSVPQQGDRAMMGVLATYPAQRQDQLLKALDQEVQRARQQGFTQAELDQARTTLQAERRARCGNDDDLLGQLKQQLETDTGFDTWARDDQRITAISLAQVNQAFTRYVDSQRWVLLTAADTGSDQGLAQSR